MYNDISREFHLHRIFQTHLQYDLAGNESIIRGYKFSYGGLNRVLNVTYGETTSISSNPNRFSKNKIIYNKSETTRFL